MTDQRFAFTKTNYIIMLAGIGLLVMGFFIMTLDTAEYGFGFFGLTLGPIIVMLGFLSQFIAILYRPKASNDSAS